MNTEIKALLKKQRELCASVYKEECFDSSSYWPSVEKAILQAPEPEITNTSALPVYQKREKPYHWIDVTKDEYDAWVFTKRILYEAPLPNTSALSDWKEKYINRFIVVQGLDPSYLEGIKLMLDAIGEENIITPLSQSDGTKWHLEESPALPVQKEACTCTNDTVKEFCNDWDYNTNTCKRNCVASDSKASSSVATLGSSSSNSIEQ